MRITCPMPSLIGTIAFTRQKASAIATKALADVGDTSEAQVRDAILSEMAKYTELYPNGWYDPPPGGVAVLFADTPFERLQFDSLRDPKFFPSTTSVFGRESVGMFYLSPIDRATGMIGDIGCSMYRGDDPKIRDHIRVCHDGVHAVCENAEVGMRFCDQYTFAMDLFHKNGKKVGWMTTTHDPLKVNLGHTIPGLLGDELPQNSFESLKEAICSRRVYTNAEEQFQIPPTCAFTLEARLTDLEEKLPNIFFHFTVTFSEGEKHILGDFDDIFRVVGMDYML